MAVAPLHLMRSAVCQRMVRGSKAIGRGVPTDRQIAVHFRRGAASIRQAIGSGNDAVNIAAAASSASRSTEPKTIDELAALRAGFDLARASQLTMVRLQLALHKSNRRSAMQALDTLLDIEAEMAELAAILDAAPAHPGDQALSGFIGSQKAAIAVEKHVLAGGDWPSDDEPGAISEPADPAIRVQDEPTVAVATPVDRPVAIDLPTPSLAADDEADEADIDDRRGSARWMAVLAAAIAFIVIAGLIVWQWPALSALR
jgi:hypothetical protein